MDTTKRSFIVTPSSGIVDTNSVRKNGGGWIADTDDTNVEYIDVIFSNLFII